MNIYNFASNEAEWTLEKASGSYPPCVYRGGSCNDSGSYGRASQRGGNLTTNAKDYIGFRPALYVK